MGRFGKNGKAEEVAQDAVQEVAQDAVQETAQTPVDNALPTGAELTKGINAEGAEVTPTDTKKGRISRALADAEDDFPMAPKAAKAAKAAGEKKEVVLKTMEQINEGLKKYGMTIAKNTVSRGILVLDVIVTKGDKKITLRQLMDAKFRVSNYAYAAGGERLSDIEGKGISTTADIMLVKLEALQPSSIGLEIRPVEETELINAYVDAVADTKKLAVSEMKAGVFTRKIEEAAPVAETPAK